MKALPLLAALLSAFAIAACQDPAGVGLDLIDDEGADPNVRLLLPTSADTVGTQAVAIGFATTNPSEPRSQTRVLVGDVVDPVFGDARAIGYVDATQPSISDGLEASDVRAIWIELRRNYAYGDTTTALPLVLRQVQVAGDGTQGTWSVTDYPADTTFATGPALATATATSAAADTTLRFNLPASWVSANAGTFLSDNFNTGFEGFEIRVADGFTPAPGAVYGFSTLTGAGSSIRVAVTDDTLVFPLGEVFSSISRSDPVAPPALALPARNYSEATAALRFDLGSVGPLPLARAVLRAPVDESLARSGAFVRPVVSRLQIVGTRDDGSAPVFLGELERTASGTYQTTGPSLRRFTTVLQGALTGDESYDRILLSFPASASLDVFPLYRPDPSLPEPPRLALTVIGGSSAP